MPHLRKRHLLSVLQHLSGVSPLVGLLGHRQVGKTTLLEGVSAAYTTLDDEDQFQAATHDPKGFISSLQERGTAIDECQLAERIFPALKERVRKDKRPGQFYLSGSVRFTSKKLIQESLTGRIMTSELLPLTLSELDEGPLPDLAIRILASKRVSDLQIPELSSKEFARRTKLIELYDSQGGLPGACFIRNEKLRNQKILDQLDTILNRDVRQIYETTLTLPELRRYISALAARDGSTIQYQTLRRLTGISPATQKKLLYALEAVFVLRMIPVEGDYSDAALFFEDQAEVITLAKDQISSDQKWFGLIYRNLREQVSYRLGENADFFQYRTRAGVFVPFAVRSPQGTLAVIPIRGTPSRASLAAAHSFFTRYSNSKAILVSDNPETRVFDNRTLQIAAANLLF